MEPAEPQENAPPPPLRPRGSAREAQPSGPQVVGRAAGWLPDTPELGYAPGAPTMPSPIATAAGEPPVMNLSRAANPLALAPTLATREPGVPYQFNLRPSRPRPRTPVLDRVALVFAFLLPLVGLLLSVVARVASRRKYGWTTRVARGATGVSIVLSLVVGLGGWAFLELNRNAAARAALVAQSAPLCSIVEEHPESLQDGSFGWPPAAATIPESIESMKQFADRWRVLLAGAPEALAGDLRTVLDTADAIIAEVEATRIVDGAANVDRMRVIASGSGIPAWVSEYCG